MLLLILSDVFMYNFVYGIDLESEPKTGIGRDNSTHTTREGLLYRAEMKRFKSLNFVVDFDFVLNF